MSTGEAGRPPAAPGVEGPGAEVTGARRISLVDVTFRYAPGDPPAVDGVRLDVLAGQVVGIVGRNGSGKSTLVRLATGLLRPASGTVLVAGLDTATHEVRELAAHAGLAFQSPGHQLFAPTVADELGFGPRNLGVAEPEVASRVAAVADELGLAGVLDEHPRRLGFALRKLVAVASVLTMHTPVVMLDEPTTGQDHRTIVTLTRLVRRLRATGSAVVVVAHDTAFLADTADRLVVLEAGRIIGDDAPRQAFADPALLARSGLVAPQITRLSLQVPDLVHGAASPALTVAELAAALLARSGTGSEAAP